MQLHPGTIIHDRYRVERPLGRGGMATTYLVRDSLWGSRVALKLLATPSAELLEDLRLEFSILTGLAHPRLTRVHDLALLRDPGSEPR
jgi:serine/threonine protein kinase